MANKYEIIFEKWLDLDVPKRMLVFSGLFGRMHYMREEGTKSEKVAAEMFFEEVEYVLKEVKND